MAFRLSQGQDAPYIGTHGDHEGTTVTAEPKRTHVSVSEAAEMMGVSGQTIRRFLEQGRLSGERTSEHGFWLVSVASIEAFAAPGVPSSGSADPEEGL